MFCSTCNGTDWEELLANVETRAGVDGYQPLDWNTQNDTACPACVFFGIEGYSRAGKRIAGTRKHGLLHTTQSWFITRRTSPHLTQPSRADNNAVSSAMLQDSSHDMNAMIGIAHHDSMEAPLAPRLVNPHINNFSDIKRWNDRCQQNHQRSCGASCPPVAMPQGFALLDCSTHQIISLAHAVPYVALSYVWGTKSSCKAEDDLPLTIRDAMTVSEELGYKYLWVDRLCVNQNDPVQKHTQINNMGIIYQNAAIVIVAAAGKDPSHGLPGVSKRARVQQRSMVKGDYKFMEMYLDLKHTLRRTEWISRAWTFQETCLAKRSLIFTDLQVAFVCGKSYCAESFRSEINHGGYLNKDIRHFFCVTNTVTSASFAGHVEQYTRRTLSYQSDALNACLGVLNSFSSRNNADSSNPLHVRSHVWGLAIINDWVQLDWVTKHIRRERRSGYPSWSWLSSTDEISYFYSIGPRLSTHILLGITQSDEIGRRTNGINESDIIRRLTIDEYLLWPVYNNQNHYKAPTLLQISGPLFKVEMLTDPITHSHSTQVVVNTRHKCKADAFFDSAFELADQHDFVALLLDKDIKKIEATDRATFLLLKKDTGSDVYTRIGLMVPPCNESIINLSGMLDSDELERITRTVIVA